MPYPSGSAPAIRKSGRAGRPQRTDGSPGGRSARFAMPIRGTTLMRQRPAYRPRYAGGFDAIIGLPSPAIPSTKVVVETGTA
jgi:hypothetical protein